MTATLVAPCGPPAIAESTAGFSNARAIPSCWSRYSPGSMLPETSIAITRARSDSAARAGEAARTSKAADQITNFMDGSKQQTSPFGEQCLQQRVGVNIIGSMLRLAFVLVAACVAIGFARLAPAAEPLSSQNCAAIAFHPVAPGTADGQQEAGFYKSRLGRIEVRASVRGGTVTRYYVSL